jgi:hypothetical protein
MQDHCHTFHNVIGPRLGHVIQSSSQLFHVATHVVIFYVFHRRCIGSNVI